MKQKTTFLLCRSIFSSPTYLLFVLSFLREFSCSLYVRVFPHVFVSIPPPNPVCPGVTVNDLRVRVGPRGVLLHQRIPAGWFATTHVPGILLQLFFLYKAHAIIYIVVFCFSSVCFWPNIRTHTLSCLFLVTCDCKKKKTLP